MMKFSKNSLILLFILGIILCCELQVGAATIEGLGDELEKQSVEVSPSENNSLDVSSTTHDSVKIAVQSLVRIVIVLIIIVVAIWFTGRYFRSKFSSRLQGRWLKIVDEVVLGPNRGVVLCKVEDKIFALGITEHQINYLFTVNDEILVQEIDHQAEDSFLNTDAAVSAFDSHQGWSSIFKRWFSSGQKKKSKDFHTLIQKNIDRVTPLTFADEREENRHDIQK